MLRVKTVATRKKKNGAVIRPHRVGSRRRRTTNLTRRYTIEAKTAAIPGATIYRRMSKLVVGHSEKVSNQ